MDFLTTLPTTLKQHDFVMVVVNKLSKATNSILVKSTHKIDDIARIFIREIVVNF
jgi:hypothetical protein